MEEPLFSVIIPTHRRAHLLRRTLRSLRDGNGDIPFEVIVVSDVVDPETDTVCAAELTERDVYVRRSGKPGPSGSRNMALTLAHGQHVLFLDDDDAWHPECLRRLWQQAAVKDSLPVYFDCTIVMERRNGVETEFISESVLALNGALTEDMLVRNQVPIPCFAFPRHILRGVMFDETMKAYEDWEFVLSVMERATPVHVDVLGARVYKVPGSENDRRGTSDNAQGMHAVLDYLYAYHRHRAPTPEIAEKRSQLLRLCGIDVAAEYL